MTKFIVGSQVLDALVEAGVILDDPSYVRRVVIDLKAGHVGMVYVEKFADEEKLRVALNGGLEVVGTEDEAGRL